MKKWKDLHIGIKLGISYSVIILVIILIGFYIFLGLSNYKKRLSSATSGYIPLVESTNNIERLTNQVMQFLWEFTALGDTEYYDLGKTTLKELKKSIKKTEKIISGLPELSDLNSGLVRINSWTNDMEMIIDETRVIQTKLNENKRNLNVISINFQNIAKGVLYKGEAKLRSEFMRDEVVSSGFLYVIHRKNRLANLILDKGNLCIINAYEAIALDNSKPLEKTFQQLNYINNITELLDSLSVGKFEKAGVEGIRIQLEKMKIELHSLKSNLNRSRELSVRRGEIASVVIIEARTMGKDGMNYAGNTLEENLLVFNRSIPAYLIGLLVALFIAIIFSVFITRSITLPIEKSVLYAEEIASGNLDAIVEINQKDEVGILAESLKYMGAHLKANIADLKKAERKMLKISFETEEREKRRMAGDLHDSLGPHLSTIKLYIDALNDESLTKEKKKFLIKSAEEIIEEAIMQAKNISYNLMPNLLNDFGLSMTLNAYCEKVNEVSPVKILLNSENYPDYFNRHVEIMLFRVIKELINNTIKHAEAQEILIKIRFLNDVLYLDYVDDGIGFNYDEPRANEKMGLSNIVGRINYISGRIDFKTKPKNGLHVKIKVEKKYLI